MIVNIKLQHHIINSKNVHTTKCPKLIYILNKKCTILYKYYLLYTRVKLFK